MRARPAGSCSTGSAPVRPDPRLFDRIRACSTGSAPVRPDARPPGRIMFDRIRVMLVPSLKPAKGEEPDDCAVDPQLCASAYAALQARRPQGSGFRVRA